MLRLLVSDTVLAAKIADSAACTVLGTVLGRGTPLARPNQISIAAG